MGAGGRLIGDRRSGGNQITAALPAAARRDGLADAVVRAAAAICDAAVVAVMVAMVVVTGAGVVSRYLAGSPLAWTDEVAGYLSVALTFLRRRWRVSRRPSADYHRGRSAPAAWAPGREGGGGRREPRPARRPDRIRWSAMLQADFEIVAKAAAGSIRLSIGPYDVPPDAGPIDHTAFSVIRLLRHAARIAI